MAQLEFFRNPNCDRVRAASGTPKHDADGLFDCEGAIEIARRRGVKFESGSDLAIKVWKTPSRTADHVEKLDSCMLTAVAPGKWDPVSVIRACSEARGVRTYDVDMLTAEPRNDERLDELKLARICAADGIRPYLSRQSGYWKREEQPDGILLDARARGRADLVVQNGPAKRHRRRSALAQLIVRLAQGRPHAPGRRPPRSETRPARRPGACRLQMDVASYLPSPAPRRNTSLDDAEDDYALACMAAGSRLTGTV